MDKRNRTAFLHLLEFLAFVEAKLGRLVEGGKVRNVGRVREEVGVRLLHVVDEHAELGSPVTDVVMSENLERMDADN